MRYVLCALILICTLTAVGLALAGPSDAAPPVAEEVVDQSSTDKEAPDQKATNKVTPDVPTASEDLPGPDKAAAGFVLAIRNGHWFVAFGFALVLVVWALRWGAGKISGWFNTRLGGWILVAVTSVAGVVGVALIEGMALSWQLLTSAVVAALVATATRKAIRDPQRAA